MVDEVASGERRRLTFRDRRRREIVRSTIQRSRWENWESPPVRRQRACRTRGVLPLHGHRGSHGRFTAATAAAGDHTGTDRSAEPGTSIEDAIAETLEITARSATTAPATGARAAGVGESGESRLASRLSQSHQGDQEKASGRSRNERRGPEAPPRGATRFQSIASSSHLSPVFRHPIARRRVRSQIELRADPDAGQDALATDRKDGEKLVTVAGRVDARSLTVASTAPRNADHHEREGRVATREIARDLAQEMRLRGDGWHRDAAKGVNSSGAQPIPRRSEPRSNARFRRRIEVALRPRLRGVEIVRNGFVMTDRTDRSPGCGVRVTTKGLRIVAET